MNPEKFPKLIKGVESQGYDDQEIKECLDDAMWQKWCTWFAGQTGFITEDGKFCVFDYDFHRFLEQQGIAVGGLNGQN